MRTALKNDVIKRAQRAGKRVEIWDTVQRGLFARVTESGVATFVVKYRVAGRQRKHKLGRVGELTITEARRQAGITLSAVDAGRDPQAEKEERRSRTDHALEDLVYGWLKDAAVERRSTTMVAYRGAASRFLAWATKAKVRTASDLDRQALTSLRAHLVSLPLHSAARGRGKSGKKVQTKARRSAAAVNHELRAIKTMLNELRRAGKLDAIDRDAISDCLRAVRGERVRPSRLTTPAIARLLAACDRHDAATYKATREEHAGAREVGTTKKHTPVKPLVVFMLLVGTRLGEALSLKWDQVDLATRDPDGKPIGQIELRAGDVKTASDRTIYLHVCPTIRKMLAARKLARGDDDRVWSEHTSESAAKARRRLVADYGAPAFLWSSQHSRVGESSHPTLRATCSTYLHSAPAIYGAGALHLACAQLGHSPEVARRHYAGVETGIPREARTLEAAMRIEALVPDVAPAQTNRRRRRAAK